MKIICEELDFETDISLMNVFAKSDIRADEWGFNALLRIPENRRFKAIDSYVTKIIENHLEYNEDVAKPFIFYVLEWDSENIIDDVWLSIRAGFDTYLPDYGYDRTTFIDDVPDIVIKFTEEEIEYLEEIGGVANE